MEYGHSRGVLLRFNADLTPCQPAAAASSRRNARRSSASMAASRHSSLTEDNVRSTRTMVMAGAMTVAMTCGAVAQSNDGLGKLSFPTSCDPKVQAEFERGVAMIHSYWFLVARRTFEGVLRQDPACAIAHWGI